MNGENLIIETINDQMPRGVPRRPLKEVSMGVESRKETSLEVSRRHLKVFLAAVHAQGMINNADEVAENIDYSPQVRERVSEFSDFMSETMNIKVDLDTLAFYERMYKRADMFVLISMMLEKLPEKTAKKIEEKMEWALWNYGKIDLNKIKADTL